MRQLKFRSRGFTLIELMIAIAIAAIVMLTAAPSVGGYITNSRLRENGNVLFVQALLAQSEAIKRNNPVSLTTSASTITIRDLADPAAPVILYEKTLGDGVSMDNAVVQFESEGRPTAFTAASIALSSSTVVCDSENRCPRLNITGGGAIRLCADKTSAGC